MSESLIKEIENYICHLSPHIKERLGHNLLIRSLEALKKRDTEHAAEHEWAVQAVQKLREMQQKISLTFVNDLLATIPKSLKEKP